VTVKLNSTCGWVNLRPFPVCQPVTCARAHIRCVTAASSVLACLATTATSSAATAATRTPLLPHLRSAPRQGKARQGKAAGRHVSPASVVPTPASGNNNKPDRPCSTNPLQIRGNVQNPTPAANQKPCAAHHPLPPSRPAVRPPRKAKPKPPFPPPSAPFRSSRAIRRSGFSAPPSPNPAAGSGCDRRSAGGLDAAWFRRRGSCDLKLSVRRQQWWCSWPGRGGPPP
jgi:hypothetical protein